MPFKPSGPLGKFARKDRTSGQKSTDKLDNYFGNWGNESENEGSLESAKPQQKRININIKNPYVMSIG